jgi:hypothetical protein
MPVKGDVYADEPKAKNERIVMSLYEDMKVLDRLERGQALLQWHVITS